MAVNFRILAFLIVLLSINQSSAFFFSWGSPEPTQQAPQQWPGPVYTYHPRFLPPPPTGEPPVPLPAIPIQTPLRAQLAPAPKVHNVQLVPCLCPVSSEDYPQEPYKDNVYAQVNNNIQPAN